MDLKLNADRFSGKDYVYLYDQARPTPPPAILQQTLNYLGKAKADCVLDLGCGTGLSTLIWQDLTDQVIGVEPSEGMLEIARTKVSADDPVQFINRYAHDLPFDDASMDIVTCSQSFHWMDPQPTLSEIGRVLKDGGVLTIYDVQWPPSVNLALEQAYRELFLRIEELTQSLGETIAHKWKKSAHLEQVQQSQQFSFSKVTYYHKTERINLHQFAAIALSQGGLEALLKRGYSEEAIGITDFLRKIEQAEQAPFDQMTLNYRVIYGVKGVDERMS